MHSKQQKISRGAAGALVTALACVMAVCAAGQARAQATRPTTVPADFRGAVSSGEPILRESGKPLQTIDIIVGQSRIVEAAWPVKRVTVADPKIADVDVSAPTRLQLVGKAVGVTEV